MRTVQGIQFAIIYAKGRDEFRSTVRIMKKNSVSINFLYQIAYQILVIISPLITVPYIARVLGAENNGVYIFTYTIVNYFVVFSAFGIEAYGNRLIAQSKTKGQDVLNHAFSSLFWLHTIVTLLVFMGYIFYVFFIAKSYKTIFIIQTIWIFSAFFDINWLFFGLEEFKISVTRNFIIKICSIVCIFVFVRNSTDLWLYTLIMGIGQFFSNIFLWKYLKKYISFSKVTVSDILSHVRPLLVLFFAVIATSIYRMIDKVMVGSFCNMNDLASYEYADRMIRLLVTIITALGTVMLPRMSALYAEGNDRLVAKYMASTTQIMFIISSALSFGLAAIADDFMPLLLGDGYDSSISITIILCVSLPVMGWNNLIRTQILMPQERDKIYVSAVWAGAIVNVVLNIVLIKYIGAHGAAIATVISYIVVGLFQTIPIWKEFGILVHLKRSIFPIVCGVCMFVLIRFVGSLLTTPLLRMIVEIITGSAFYVFFSICYLYKSNNEVFFTYLHKVKNKL